MLRHAKNTVKCLTLPAFFKIIKDSVTFLCIRPPPTEDTPYVFVNAGSYIFIHSRTWSQLRIQNIFCTDVIGVSVTISVFHNTAGQKQHTNDICHKFEPCTKEKLKSASVVLMWRRIRFRKHLRASLHILFQQQARNA